MDDIAKLRWKVVEIVTVVIEDCHAFGMTLGGIEWEAGQADGEFAYPKGKDRNALSADELVATLNGV